MIKAGFLQFCPVRRDVAANVAAIERLLDGVQADLMVLPELSNSGYMYGAPEDLAPYAEDASGNGPYLAALRELAGRMGGLIVAGFAEAALEGLYNSAALVDGKGVRQVYRKTHLFWDEKDLFLPGNSGFRVLEHACPGGSLRVGAMICFDWIFPEAARTLALAGSQVIAHPSNLVMPWCQQAMVTRSLENGVFSITANRYGIETLGEKILTFTGCSQVLDTKGRRLLEAPSEGDCVTVTEIDPSAADDKALNPRNDRFADRRPDAYRLQFRLASLSSTQRHESTKGTKSLHKYLSVLCALVSLC